MSSGSSSRPPRRDDKRPGGANRSGRPSGGGSRGRSGDGSKSAGKGSGGKYGKPSGGRSGGGKSSGGRPSGGRSNSAQGDRRGRPAKPMTEAERRAAEVRARRAPRAPRNPELERERIESRTTEEWIDEGSVRREAERAANRAGGASEPAPKKRPPKPLDPEVSAELVDALGAQRGARLSERLAQASEALDRERFQEARRIASSIAKEAPSVAAAHELVGLSAYRLGYWKQAATELQIAQDLHPEPSLLPVIADCHRAQRRWAAVDRVWTEIREASPSHEIMAEGRMVAAGALADQDDLAGAIAIMEPATKRPKAVREFHVRQWYVLGDLYDRIGDPIAARRWFEKVADVDAEFADVLDRLRGLGR